MQGVACEGQSLEECAVFGWGLSRHCRRRLGGLSSIAPLDIWRMHLVQRGLHEGLEQHPTPPRFSDRGGGLRRDGAGWSRESLLPGRAVIHTDCSACKGICNHEGCATWSCSSCGSSIRREVRHE